MSILANMMTQLMPYVCENNLDMKHLIIITDIALCKVEVDITSRESLSSYIKTMSKINELYKNLDVDDVDIWVKHSDGSVFDNDKVKRLEDYPEAVERFQNRRLNIWKEYYPNIINSVTTEENDEDISLDDLPM